MLERVRPGRAGDRPGPPDHPLLEVRDVEVTYGSFQVLWGVSLSVTAGWIACLLGTNGSGKSTLMNAVAGLVTTQAGEVWFDGVRVDGQPTHRLVELGLVLVPERRRIFPELSVWENLWLGAWTHPARKHRKESLERVFELFPILKERRFQLAGGLSGGQQQMVAIGRGLMARPRLLLLDEPFLGLTQAMIVSISEALRRINAEGITVLLIDQDVERALTLSAYAFLLESGKLVLAGDSAALLQNESAWQAYLGAHGL